MEYKCEIIETKDQNVLFHSNACKCRKLTAVDRSSLWKDHGQAGRNRSCDFRRILLWPTITWIWKTWMLKWVFLFNMKFEGKGEIQPGMIPRRS